METQQDTDPVCIETDLFLFEAPIGFQIVSLDEVAELVGPNDENVVVSSYSLEEDISDETISDFKNSIINAMVEAANEPDLIVTGKLNKVTADNDLPIWSLLSEAKDETLFFDQYAVIRNETAVIVIVEGGLSDRMCSTKIEESIHSLEFK